MIGWCCHLFTSSYPSGTLFAIFQYKIWDRFLQIHGIYISSQRLMCHTNKIRDISVSFITISIGITISNPGSLIYFNIFWCFFPKHSPSLQYVHSIVARKHYLMLLNIWSSTCLIIDILGGLLNIIRLHYSSNHVHISITTTHALLQNMVRQNSKPI